MTDSTDITLVSDDDTSPPDHGSAGGGGSGAVLHSGQHQGGARILHQSGFRKEHSISNRFFQCFSYMIDRVHQNSSSMHFRWANTFSGGPIWIQEGLYRFRRANTEPSVHFRKANTEPSVHFRRANTELSVHFRRANTET